MILDGYKYYTKNNKQYCLRTWIICLFGITIDIPRSRKKL